RKLARLPPAVFLKAQLEGMFVLAAPVWVAGIAFYLFLGAGRGLRAFGWAFLSTFALLALSRGGTRAVYLASAYTWILPAGGVALEAGLARVRGWVRVAIIVALLAAGLLTLPVVLPVLPEKRVASVLARQDHRRVEE